MKALPSLSVVVPAYNEAANLTTTVLEAAPCLSRYVDTPIQWILVDDGSTDGTWSKVQQLTTQLPYVTPAQHSLRQGLGAAIWTGMVQVQGEWFTWMPADGQLSPEAVIQMIEQTSNAELVMLMREESKRSLPRRVLTFGFYALMRLSFGFDPYGFSGAFLVRYDRIADLPLRATTAVQNYAVVLHCLQGHCPMAQSYTVIQPRRSGKSKVANLSTMLRTFYEVAKLNF